MFLTIGWTLLGAILSMDGIDTLLMPYKSCLIEGLLR